jgi:exopolysaccharide biosynthesis WecB/TagA/CpsF family protein
VTLAILLGLAGCCAGLAGLYLLGLAVAAFFYRDTATTSAKSHLVVLIPAHNEADLLSRCLNSLEDQDYERQQYDLLVIADNCTDDTAPIAAARGAEVWERDEPNLRGKGHALRWAIDRLLRDRPAMDAVVVIDADSVADSGLLRALASVFESGAPVVQAQYLALEDDVSPKGQLRAAGLLLFHRVRFAGRAALGLPCQLVGNGMLFSRRLLEEHPWNAYSNVEDLEYSTDLRLAGVRPTFAGTGRVWAPISSHGQSAQIQRLRWEGGRFHVVRTRLPKLLAAIVTQRRWSLLDAAVDLAVPPLGLLVITVGALLALTVTLVAATLVPAVTLIPALLAALILFLYVLVGFRAGRAPAGAYRALVAAPALVIRDLITRTKLLGGLRTTTWERSRRPSDMPLPADKRAEIAGVPIDPVNLDDALGRTRSAVATRSFMQVCTVNLDFLVSARRDPEVQALLRTSELNLADGSPVVWLSRILGSALPGRASGADFVPHLMAAAARDGARVFLLGGENGAAELAAQHLTTCYPDLVLAGVFEPPVAAVDALDNAEILRRLDDADPDILLVALGHPKQDKWISANRDRLPVSVAVGVGCTFDLLAGRRRRAPSFMQNHGLEWLYRLAHEPRRLFVRYAVDAWCLLAYFLPATLYQRFAGEGGHR